MQKKDYYTTSEVAKLLSVAVGSVINWVDDGKLEAIVTPGGHRKSTSSINHLSKNINLKLKAR